MLTVALTINAKLILAPALKGPCHAFPVITRPLVCYEGFYACKRCAESKPSKYTL